MSNWDTKHIKMIVRGATDKLLNEIAVTGQGYTRVNIRDNGQIDTGFMINSVFVVTPKTDDYYDASVNAHERNEDVSMGERPRIGENEAVIGVGAEYAIYQEAANSFLWKAAEQLRDRFPQIVRTVKF